MHLQKEISDMGKTIAIGDIHGCSAALGLLIDIVQPDRCDTLICLGDIIDYGPNSKEVVEQLLELNEKTNLVLIMGNHEEMLLEVVKGNEDKEYWKKFGGDKALASYQCDHPREIPYEHLNFIGKSVPFLETETNIFVHAGYQADLPLQETTGSTLRWDFLNAKKALPHFSGKTAVLGHTPQTSGEIHDLGFLICIDTDCSRQGWLTGLDVNTGQYWQVNQEGAVRKRFRA